MRICVIGAGYVGLATAVMLGKLGHDVVIDEIDRDRVELVEKGKLPFHEPEMEKELKALVKAGSLTATSRAHGPVEEANFIFICVQTPSLESGAIDIEPVKSACKSVGRVLSEADDYKIVVIRSTVVPSTTDTVLKPILEELSGKSSSEDFGLCANPEFLREGFAFEDSMKPSRIVIGSEDARAGKLLADLYAGIDAPKVVTDLRSAEMIKYASNSFLATKITFANEIANICLRFGIDSEVVLKAAGMDPRIGPMFLRPGLGYGGSCLPKDVKALREQSRMEGYESILLAALESINESQPSEGVMLLEGAVGELKGKRIAVLGLAFKGGVDDIRDTRAVPLIEELLSKGAEVVAYDPMAMPNFRRIMPDIQYSKTADHCLKDADGCIIQADWEEFKKLGKKQFSTMKTPIVVDGRRCLDPKAVRAAGAVYLGIGYGSMGEG